MPASLGLSKNNAVLLWTLLMIVYVVSTTPLSPEISEHWENFKNVHQKEYEKEEEEVRRNIFAKNLQAINKHNKEEEQGFHTFRMGVNKFTDMTREEMASHMTSMSVSMPPPENTFHLECAPELPKEVDWRKEGIVTFVRNQGRCGSCYTFSAVGAIEGQYIKKYKKVMTFSEQNILDCATAEGNARCAGGWPFLAFQYVIDNKGLESRKTYPYLGYNSTCHFNRSNVAVTLKEYANVTSGSECDLKKAVGGIGPVSIVIDSNHTSLGLYSSGVYYEPECTADYFTHAMLVVGYGTDAKYGDYWLIKNSWGSAWGEEGYIRMARNRNNNCGVASLACYPII